MTEEEKYLILLIREDELTIEEVQLSFFDRYNKWVTRTDILTIYIKYQSTPIFLLKKNKNKIYLRKL